jgi:hypothetical protein
MTNIPKSITICGKPNKVIQDKSGNGGAFDEGKGIIVIGTANPLDVPEILVHEVVEAVLVTRLMRYAIERSQPENGDYIFVFNHDQFEIACKDIAAALKGIKF